MSRPRCGGQAAADPPGAYVKGPSRHGTRPPPCPKPVADAMGGSMRAGREAEPPFLLSPVSRLGEDSRAALADLPPECLPQMREDEATALRDSSPRPTA